MKLTQKEEQLMNFIWQLKKAYMKDLLDVYPEPKPATTTLATLLKRLASKGAVGYNLHGNSREYYPILQKKDYSSSYLKNMIKMFFQGSSATFASFFTNNMSLSREELLELRDMIDDKLNDEKK